MNSEEIDVFIDITLVFVTGVLNLDDDLVTKREVAIKMIESTEHKLSVQQMLIDALYVRLYYTEEMVECQ